MNSSTKKNFIYSSLYQVLVLVLPLITTPYVSRVFGAENLGVYSYTNTIAQYFVIFAMLGLNNYGNRAVAMARDDKEELNAVFSEIYTMQLVTGILSLLVYVVYAVFVAQDYKTYSLILTLYVLSAVFDINWLFFGLEKFKLTVTRNSIIKIGSVVAILVLVKTKDDLLIYTSIYAVSMFLSTIALWPYARKEGTGCPEAYKAQYGHVYSSHSCQHLQVHGQAHAGWVLKNGNWLLRKCRKNHDSSFGFYYSVWKCDVTQNVKYGGTKRCCRRKTNDSNLDEICTGLKLRTYLWHGRGCA